MDNDVDKKPVTNTVKARGGVTGHNVRYVLGVSLVLAIIAMVVAAAFI
jgi:hypothetical protein